MGWHWIRRQEWSFPMYVSPSCSLSVPSTTFTIQPITWNLFPSQKNKRPLYHLLLLLLLRRRRRRRLLLQRWVLAKRMEFFSNFTFNHRYLLYLPHLSEIWVSRQLHSTSTWLKLCLDIYVYFICLVMMPSRTTRSVSRRMTKLLKLKKYLEIGGRVGV